MLATPDTDSEISGLGSSGTTKRRPIRSCAPSPPIMGAEVPHLFCNVHNHLKALMEDLAFVAVTRATSGRYRGPKVHRWALKRDRILTLGLRLAFESPKLLPPMKLKETSKKTPATWWSLEATLTHRNVHRMTIISIL